MTRGLVQRHHPGAFGKAESGRTGDGFVCRMLGMQKRVHTDGEVMASLAVEQERR